MTGMPKPGEEEEKKLIAAMNEKLDKFVAILGDKKFLAGDNMTLGDIHIYSMLSLFDRVSGVWKSDDNATLKAYYGRIEANASIAKCTANMDQSMAEMAAAAANK